MRRECELTVWKQLTGPEKNVLIARYGGDKPRKICDVVRGMGELALSPARIAQIERQVVERIEVCRVRVGAVAVPTPVTA